MNDLSEIFEVIDQTDESRLKRERLKKMILKTYKKTGALDYSQFPPGFRWNLCAARMRLGKFDNYDGWVFRSEWSITFQELNGHENPLPKWDGDLSIKKLVILGEQGVGDEILFASAIPELIVRLGRDAIEFQCNSRLKGIFERSFGIKCVDRKVLTQITDGDAIVALADLFMFYRRDKSHFPRKPFLKPGRNWNLDEISGPKIGIAWKARHGSLDPRDLMFEDATYINLQYGETELPDGVYDAGADPLVSMEDHLSLIASLDKVVTVTQTVVHEAGAVGTECHAIRPVKGSGEVNNNLWYHGKDNCDHVLYGCVKVWNTVEDYKRFLRNSQ